MLTAVVHKLCTVAPDIWGSGEMLTTAVHKLCTVAPDMRALGREYASCHPPGT